MIKDMNCIFRALDKEAEKLHDYSEDMMFDAELTGKFVSKVLERHINEKGIQLKKYEKSMKRRSVRSFSDKPVNFDDFAAVLSELGCERENGKYRFSYPSAGGLYPIDTYVYIKEKRVEGIDRGLYLYLPVQHELKPISSQEIPIISHYYGNREIFGSSAFSLYFIYDCDSSMPKYSGMGMYYGILDSGIMLERITSACTKYRLGSCIIGDMNFDLIRELFGLSDNMVFLHCMEVGYFDE